MDKQAVHTGHVGTQHMLHVACQFVGLGNAQSAIRQTVKTHNLLARHRTNELKLLRLDIIGPQQATYRVPESLRIQANDLAGLVSQFLLPGTASPASTGDEADAMAYARLRLSAP